ncbi:Crossover junction endonuclease EME1 [Fasciola hepatica]|uniref:Crossover junction endonuclease EME1 n=1 Tax=Fasciola hepatica TaxID=6192 RepID=A0A4E0RL24_FASHE|nr:Crossover junction endonuclease EME1 [Fasciola hepatica]
MSVSGFHNSYENPVYILSPSFLHACTQKLVTCEFDQQLLQFPGLLGALTPKLESGWQSATMIGPDYDQLVRDSWPLMIQPLIPGIHGPQGAVPLSHSFTWTRFIPRIEDSVSPDHISLTTCSVHTRYRKTANNLLTVKNRLHVELEVEHMSEISSLAAFGAQLQNLNRPVTCIFLTGAKFRASNKEGRLEQDSGLAFLPDTVRMGLTGCASRGRGAGPAPGSALINTDPDQTERAAHAWANQIWLAQLGQWRGLTGEIAHSITLSFPTARAFYHQSGSSSDSHPFETPLSNLEIRRGAGILASRRRLGPEFARRLITHFVSENPNQVIE